jgi:hypothetical protein
MRTSFHHQPEAQHPIFQLSTSWQADYPIFRCKADMQRGVAPIASVANDPKRTNVTMTFSQCGVFGATKKALAFSSPAGAFSALP